MAKKAPEVFAVQLGYNDRITLSGVLPQQGSIASMRIAQEIREKVAVTGKEWDAVKPEYLNRCEHCKRDGSMSWDASLERGRTFKFEGFEVALIVSRLKKLSEDEEITERHIYIYTKFVGEE